MTRRRTGKLFALLFAAVQLVLQPLAVAMCSSAGPAPCCCAPSGGDTAAGVQGAYDVPSHVDEAVPEAQPSAPGDSGCCDVEALADEFDPEPEMASKSSGSEPPGLASPGLAPSREGCRCEPLPADLPPFSPAAEAGASDSRGAGANEFAPERPDLGDPIVGLSARIGRCFPGEPARTAAGPLHLRIRVLLI